MKKVMLLIVSAAFSMTVNAASFDFVAAAAANEHGAASLGFNDGSVHVTATATVGNAYLDEGAGLGVCQILDKNAQCNPSNDDNIEVPEELVLTFNEATELLDFSLKNGDHRTSFTGTFNFFVDGVLQAISGPLASSFSGSWTGTEFKFVNTSANSTDVEKQFYVSNISTVPVPAALFLFAPALLGFFGLRRKATSALAA